MCFNGWVTRINGRICDIKCAKMREIYYKNYINEIFLCLLNNRMNCSSGLNDQVASASLSMMANVADYDDD